MKNDFIQFFIKNHIHLRDLWAKIMLQFLFSLTKRSNLIVFFFLSMSLETIFRFGEGKGLAYNSGLLQMSMMAVTGTSFFEYF